MDQMFYYCFELDSLDLSGFRTENVENMYAMFYATALTSIDLSSFNTAKVQNMSDLFGCCHNLTTIDVSVLNTSNVTNMAGMFYDCAGLTSLDLTNFDTSNATDMSWMFHNCHNLTSLDISSFDVEKVENLTAMFEECWKLERIYCDPDDSWSGNLMNLQNDENMFNECYRLVGVCGELSTPYDPEFVDCMYAQPCSPQYGGYFTVPEMKCATPTLRYQDGQVLCACETEGVNYVYSVVPTSLSGTSTDGVIPLDIEFMVKVRAVREGYQSSDVATLHINLSDVGDFDGDGRITVTDITRMINLVLNAQQ